MHLPSNSAFEHRHLLVLKLYNGKAFPVILLQTQPTWGLGNADVDILIVGVVEIDVIEIVQVGVGFSLGCRSEQRGCGFITVEIQTLGSIFDGAIRSNEQADDAHIIIIEVLIQRAGEAIIDRLPRLQ